MNYILITLQCDGATEDLKVPAFVPVDDLIEIFGELYRFEGKALHAEPKGMILDKSRTLEEQGVLHGAKLTIA